MLCHSLRLSTVRQAVSNGMCLCARCVDAVLCAVCMTSAWVCMRARVRSFSLSYLFLSYISHKHSFRFIINVLVTTREWHTRPAAVQHLHSFFTTLWFWRFHKRSQVNDDNSFCIFSPIHTFHSYLSIKFRANFISYIFNLLIFFLCLLIVIVGFLGKMRTLCIAISAAKFDKILVIVVVVVVVAVLVASGTIDSCVCVCVWKQLKSFRENLEGTIEQRAQSHKSNWIDEWTLIEEIIPQFFGLRVSA